MSNVELLGHNWGLKTVHFTHFIPPHKYNHCTMCLNPSHEVKSVQMLGLF